ncbi:hypothetical protein JCM33374_g3934 [Metschnikowia sp. JCM 33374]|nr:hypothetical protein JCM33374_g3934 [Metschnikowia sp. JCM 33374]
MTLRTNIEHPLTSEYHVPSNSKDNRLLVFIPGNPGLIDYYTTYLDLIQQEFPNMGILALSHAGFQTSDDYVNDGLSRDFEFYNLDYQVAHKCRIIKEHIMAGNSKLVFLCHSVGGYITQRVISRLLSDEDVKDVIEIEFVGLVCPTIVDIAKSDSGVLFTKLFTYLPIIQMAVCFLTMLQWILPDSLARTIISKFIIARPVTDDEKSMESWKNAIDATFKIYKSKRIARQALTLAREELQVIHRDDGMNDWFFEEIPKTHNIQIWCFFAESDYWVHDNTRDYILSRYHDQKNKLVSFEIGESSTEHTRAITHSFCIDQSVEFAKITCQALR